MQSHHLELVRVIERVHRRYFDLLRVELTRLGVDDISPSQVMLLFTIGEDELSVRDLLERGHYLGSNASYNLSSCWRPITSSGPRLPATAAPPAYGWTRRAANLCNLIRSVDETYHRLVARDAEETRELGIAFAMLRRLEFVWTNALRYGNG